MEWGRKPRAFGAWYVTEHMVRAMRAYGWTIIVGALGQPILYLLGLAVGLAALIDAPVAERRRGGALSRLRRAGAADDRRRSRSPARSSPTPSWPGSSGGATSSASARRRCRPSQIATGVVFGAAARMIVVAVAYTAFLYIFGADPRPGHRRGCRSSSRCSRGSSFGIPLMAYAASIEDDKGQFALVQRFIFMPMFLFSGTFYPLSHAAAVAAVDRLDLAAVARDRARAVAHLRAPDRAGDARRALRLPAHPHGRRLRRRPTRSSERRLAK